MAVKIRLQRHGKKGKPFYWVVAADARSKRDGKYLEKLGTYNPNTNPATIELNLDKAVQWLHNGAQPTDTARAILSYRGVLLKHHLDGGVRKGAITQEQADAKLAKWLEEKAGKIDSKKEGLNKAKATKKAEALKAEQQVKEARTAAAQKAAAEATAAEEIAEEVSAEATETVKEEVTAVAEAVSEEAAETTSAEEVVAEVAEEVENPAGDQATEESTDEAEA